MQVYVLHVYRWSRALFEVDEKRVDCGWGGRLGLESTRKKGVVAEYGKGAADSTMMPQLD